MTIERYAHLVGGARMAAAPRGRRRRRRPQRSSASNLYLVDGSVLPTQGSANPALTIMALAARAADLTDHAADRAASPKSRPREPLRRSDRPSRRRHLHRRHPRNRSGRHPALGRHHRGRRPCARGGAAGLGWTYSTPAAAAVITEQLSPVVTGRDAIDIAGAWEAMHRSLPQPRHPRPGHAGPQRRRHRPVGPQGPAARRASDRLLGASRRTRADLRLRRLHHPRPTTNWPNRSPLVRRWLHRHEDQDRRGLGHRHRPRSAPGPPAARTRRNGRRADGRRQRRLHLGQARRVGAALDDLGVVWFEEPVSSDDIDGLCRRANAVRCDVAAGEYVSDLYDAAASLAGRRLPAARRHPLRRLHRLAGCRRGRRGPQPAKSRLTAPPHCTPRSPPPSPTCGTSNGSSTTPGSNPSCSTGYPQRPTGPSHSIPRGPATEWPSPRAPTNTTGERLPAAF